MRVFRCTPAERVAVLDALRRVLEAQEEVVFAYVYGSFLDDRPFHDVDVAVYLEGLAEPEMSKFAMDLARDLEESLSLVLSGAAADREGDADPPVDVRVLNQAPLGFRYHVFRGRPLVSRNEALRTQVVERTVSRYLDLKPLRQRALKEAMTSWI
jgi:predicted nucleotidyltransferase